MIQPRGCGLLLALLLCPTVEAEDPTLGIFSQQSDVGEVKHAGQSQFNAENQTYQLAGSGTNMWFAEDQFQFVWRKLNGNFVLRCDGELVGEGVDPHRKFGWMIRSTLETDSPYVDVAVHGDGLTSMQFRRSKGADTEQVESELRAPDVIQLQRHNGTYIMSVARRGEPFSVAELDGIELGDEVYVGLFICAHNPDITERAMFRNVRIVVPAADDFQPYRDYIGSHLEVMAVSDGHRRIVHSVNDSLQAPNWTPDDRELLYNRNGLIYLFNLSSGNVRQLDTGRADQNNNDHVISFDGKQLGISHHTGPKRNSVVYTLPISGGSPHQVTREDAHSYLHGWSPDGNYLIYTAQRDGDFDIYRIPSSGGVEVNLTKTPGLDDGSEYTPDGKTIYFNSARDGLMQIWKMDANGSNQQQVTDDQFNNWFPHVSPDGHSIVMLSFDKTVDPTDHPFYRHVYLRTMSVEGGNPTVVAYLYGGQGTINVPSWSPDSTRIAFVSNSIDATKVAP